ncbi:hypothetical protein NHX12_025508 [Muraenolepis orangiensis]|uniref:Leucine-rich repeat, immunoglobulin-like domain and transmembrane domain-containing protein 1 n=1 Tax=Muraenolepis orangiensis TaxID=630683 RepID=A0A9Q0EM89_9TELE|nr:hypothetical protein NHX12_025508 [Muraenolepis orangiensis]
MNRDVPVGFYLVLVCLPLLSSSCPSQCGCFYHKLSDGSTARSVLCNQAEITTIPPNLPKDTSKLRIEKTAVTRISRDNFHYLDHLEVLWMSFNSLSSLSVDSFRGLSRLDELRLNGNAIQDFPWRCLTSVPHLRLLDLHSNKVSSLPGEAARYIGNITYLDLSSNALTTVPSEVLSMWLNVRPSPESSQHILGLHDNPWRCDCRLYELVQFQKSPWSSVALLDPQLKCANPESLSGVLFTETDPQRCQGPRVHTAVARVRSSLGNNVLLRCGTVGVPVPDLTWYRADGQKMSGTVQEEISKEGIVWSILSVPAVSFHDSGHYVCKATNFVGTADAIISLVINNSVRSEEIDGAFQRTGRNESGGTGKTSSQEELTGKGSSQEELTGKTSSQEELTGKGSSQEELTGKTSSQEELTGKTPSQEELTGRYEPSPSPPTTAAQQPLVEPLSGATVTGGVESYAVSSSDTEAPAAGPDPPAEPQEEPVHMAAGTWSLQQAPEKRVVRSVKVIGDTDHTVSLNWRAPTATNTTQFSVLYAVFGERDMRRINVGAGKNRITVDGLVPKTKYIACVCVKGLIPRKEQCVIFSTDEAASASGTQKLINVVVITVACVIAVPLTLIVCCGALKKRCQKLLGTRSKEMQDSYVTFETLAPGNKTKGPEGEYLARLNPDESNRLLSARSSVDSEATVRAEGPPNEYFC